MAVKVSYADAKAELDEIMRQLTKATTDLMFLENVETALEQGTEEFSPQAPATALKAAKAKLTVAQKRLAALLNKL